MTSIDLGTGFYLMMVHEIFNNYEDLRYSLAIQTSGANEKFVKKSDMK